MLVLEYNAQLDFFINYLVKFCALYTRFYGSSFLNWCQILSTGVSSVVFFKISSPAAFMCVFKLSHQPSWNLGYILAFSSGQWDVKLYVHCIVPISRYARDDLDVMNKGWVRDEKEIQSVFIIGGLLHINSGWLQFAFMCSCGQSYPGKLSLRLPTRDWRFCCTLFPRISVVHRGCVYHFHGVYRRQLHIQNNSPQSPALSTLLRNLLQIPSALQWCW